MVLLLGKRMESAVKLQKVLTEYGCYIKTRLGLHEIVDASCSGVGMVILELVGDKEKHGELYNTLKKASCVSVDIQMMTIENC
jgi:hypothetical protein